SDDVMAAVFPALTACQNENPTGPIEIPDHPLVEQTMYDCLHEAMDVDGLRELVGSLESGNVTVTCRDTTEPSVLAHEIINSQPYTFLDDAPLEERRSRSITLRRGLPVDAHDLAALDPDAIVRVRAEVAPEPRDADELHDLLLATVVLRADAAWRPLFDELAASRRAVALQRHDAQLWCAAENRRAVEALLPGAEWQSDVRYDLDDGEPPAVDEVAAAMIAGHLELGGPTTTALLAETTTAEEPLVAIAMAQLEGRGFAIRGSFDPALDGEQWCARRLLIRIHTYTQHRLRREIEPVTAQDFMRFLLRWQRVAPDAQREGRAGLAATIAQLQGFEIPVGAWESEILPARVTGYHAAWLDQLCLSGEAAWGRLRVREAPDDETAGARSSAFPSRATPVTLLMRADLPWLLQAVRGEARPLEPGAGAARDVLDAMRRHGALFTGDIASATRRLPSDVEAGLWDGVARGLVSADGFAAVRGLLVGRRWSGPQARRRGLRRGVSALSSGEGRWSLLPEALPVDDADELAEAVAEQLLVRWGVVFRDLLVRETLALPWREVLWALRRMEARGIVRGGRFVTGFAGEQFALPEAVDALRRVRRAERADETVRINATDPLNLAGIVLPGPRIPSVRTNVVTYRDGVIVPADHESLDVAARAIAS
ncbi:MAG TPA: DEAD/DEAH box helicase, partial [Candidatus Dormibacteraeota bacterium]